jgi:hypothetical protein
MGLRVVEGGAAAERERRRSDHAIRAFVPPGEDPVARHDDLGWDGDIRGGIAELPSPLVPVHDGPPDLMRATEQIGSPDDVAVEEQLADPGRRHRMGPGLARLVQQGEADDVEAGLDADPLQQRDVAGAAVAEVEVRADDEGLDGQQADQHRGHELLG